MERRGLMSKCESCGIDPEAHAEVCSERDGWRHVVEYYLGDDFVDTHTPQEARDEAMRRALELKDVEAQLAESQAAVAVLREALVLSKSVRSDEEWRVYGCPNPTTVAAAVDRALATTPAAAGAELAALRRALGGLVDFLNDGPDWSSEADCVQVADLLDEANASLARKGRTA